jgi:predicted RNase H-related nuclease YkuK (DUF458 family)
MEKVFKELGGTEIIDLVPYLRKTLNSSNDIKMLIGSDSHNTGKYTTYVTAIVLHFGNRGARVLYHKENVPRVRDNFSRLWSETERSISVAEYLKQNGIRKADYIDMDYNPNPRYQSNNVLQPAVGYVESMGYVARVKPDSPAASNCADGICH